MSAGPALNDHLGLVVASLSKSLQPESQDAEMKLKLLTTVAMILQNTDQTHPISMELLEPFLLSLLKGIQSYFIPSIFILIEKGHRIFM